MVVVIILFACIFVGTNSSNSPIWMMKIYCLDKEVWEMDEDNDKSGGAAARGVIRGEYYLPWWCWSLCLKTTYILHLCPCFLPVGIQEFSCRRRLPMGVSTESRRECHLLRRNNSKLYQVRDNNVPVSIGPTQIKNKILFANVLPQHIIH